MKLLYLALFALYLAASSLAQGSIDRGPGDTVPPGGGSGDRRSIRPRPLGPSAPSPDANTQRLARLRLDWSSPQDPSIAPDLSRWEFWWGFHHDRLLERAFGSRGRPSVEELRSQVIPALEETAGSVSASDLALARVGQELLGPERTRQLHARLAARLARPFEGIKRGHDARKVILALGCLGDSASSEMLMELAVASETARAALGQRDVSFGCRTFAVHALGVLAQRSNSAAVRQRVASFLVEVVESDNERIPDARAAAVIALGVVPLPWRNGVPGGVDRRAVAGSMLAWIAPGAQESRDFRVGVRMLVAGAMAMTAEDAVFDDDYRERWVAWVERLSQPASERRWSRPVLEQSRVLALGHLACFAADASHADPAFEDAATPLVDVLMSTGAGHADRQARAFAVMGLARTGRQSPVELALRIQQYLLAGLALEDGGDRAWRALALGVLWNARVARGEQLPAAVREALRAGLAQEKDARDRAAFALALGLTGDASSRQHILAALGRGAPARPRGAMLLALALAERDSPSADLDRIVADRLRESGFDVFVAMEGALGFAPAAGERANARLVSLLRWHPRPSAVGAAVRALAHRPGGVNDAVELLRDDKASLGARSAAAQVLGRACDPHGGAWSAAQLDGWNYRANVSTTVNATETGWANLP